MYIYIKCNHENDVPSMLLPQWLLITYTFLVPMNQRLINKLGKEHNRSDYELSTTYRRL